YLGSRNRYCTCTPKQITAYNNRVSGPIQDRMDLLLELPTVPLAEDSMEQNEPSVDIRPRVLHARERQAVRYHREANNATTTNERVLECSSLKQELEMMMGKWGSKYHWSTRVQMKIRRLARTISDLNGDDNITNEAIWEAVTMRRASDVSSQK